MSIRCLVHKEINGRLFGRRRKEKQLARMQIAKCIVVLNTFAYEATTDGIPRACAPIPCISFRSKLTS